MQMTRICLDFLLELLPLLLSYYFFVRQCKVHTTTVRRKRRECIYCRVCSKNKKESLMSGIFFHASMPHYDLDKGVGGVVTKA